MPWINTHELEPGVRHPHGVEQQIYCGLDTMVTFEVREALEKQFNTTPDIYDFTRALQAPYLDIMLTGFRVNEPARRRACETLASRAQIIQKVLNRLADAWWDKGLNPASPKQMKDFLYGAMGLPEVFISQKGERKVSANREALEKLEERYLHSRPIVSCVLALRDILKQKQVLETEVDSDGRMRTSYNIAGTETGRPSSSSNAFGTGGNLQNVAPALRYVFEADPGTKICAIDLEQVEARDVGFFCGCLFGDWTFLDNCESGDLHTNNAKLVWPELPWTGDPRLDKAIAEGQYYRDFSYRDFSKRGGHLSNYSGTAWTMARVLKIPQDVAVEFQARYVRGGKLRGVEIEPAFPCIEQYWQWIASELQSTGQLTTPFGRRRHFMDRLDDPATIREAIAFLPQSTTADRMNLGLWRVWKKMPQVQLLAQTFDSITFQYEDRGADYEGGLITEALEHIRVELVSPSGRSFVVPGEAKIGWNWGNQHRPGMPISPKNKFNPDGLQKWSASKPDLRKRKVGISQVLL